MNASLPFVCAAPAEKPANILAAARALVPHLNRSRTLDRKLIAGLMTTTFGASDAEGAWSWRDAYDAVEVALALQIRRLAPQIARLEDAPAEICALLTTLAALTPTQTRRSEEQVDLDQFSTPPQLAALAVLAAQVRADDRVLEPSAGTGLMAVVAEACGAVVTLNELSVHRAALLDGLFPSAAPSRHDAVHLKDLLSRAGAFDAVLVNPPFKALERHLHAALDVLADGGRMAAIVPSRLFDDAVEMARLSARGALIAAVTFPPRAYAGHGTSVETGLLVIDRAVAAQGQALIASCESLAEAATKLASLPLRPTVRPRRFATVSASAMLTPGARSLASAPSRLALVAHTAPVDYVVAPWRGEGHRRLRFRGRVRPCAPPREGREPGGASP